MNINMNILDEIILNKTDVLCQLNKNDLNRPLNNGYTPLEFALISQSNECVRCLLDLGCSLSEDSCLYAAMYGNTDGMNVVLEFGADPNALDCEGWTPLHWAVQENHIKCVKLLLEYGGDVNAINNDGTTPLYIAAGDNNTELTKLLLKHGAQVDLTETTSPFQIACAFQCYECCDILLENKAEVDFRDEDGRTALFYSIVKDDLDMVKYLVNKGASSSCIDNYGISIGDLKKQSIKEKLYYELFFDDEKYPEI